MPADRQPSPPSCHPINPLQRTGPSGKSIGPKRPFRSNSRGNCLKIDVSWRRTAAFQHIQCNRMPPNPAPVRHLKSLCIFCGSQSGADPAYGAAATALGGALARHDAALVFGGGKVGLMGACADATLAGGGKVIGVIPTFLRDKELAHPGASEMIVVPDMHTRKRIMFERADAFCILPGGVGTLDETFEIITWRQLHVHNKPIVI